MRAQVRRTSALPNQRSPEAALHLIAGSDESRSSPPYVTEFRVDAGFRLESQSMGYAGLLTCQVSSVPQDHARLYLTWESRNRFEAAQDRLMNDLADSSPALYWSGPQTQLWVKQVSAFRRPKTYYTIFVHLVAIICGFEVFGNASDFLFAKGQLEHVKTETLDAVADRPREHTLLCRNTARSTIQDVHFQSAHVLDAQGNEVATPHRPTNRPHLEPGDEMEFQIEFPGLSAGQYTLLLKGYLRAGIVHGRIPFELKRPLKVWKPLSYENPTVNSVDSPRRATMRFRTHVGQEATSGLLMSVFLSDRGDVEIRHVYSDTLKCIHERIETTSASKMTWSTRAIGPTTSIDSIVLLVSKAEKTKPEWVAICRRLQVAAKKK